MRQPLAKIEVIKKMAYPKSKHLPDVSYKEQICIKCDEKYLTQALIENEIDFCPKCEDYRFCEESAEVYHKSEGAEANNGLWYAFEYLKHKCLECEEEMEENQKFCSKECHDEYYIDLNDYRND